MTDIDVRGQLEGLAESLQYAMDRVTLLRRQLGILLDIDPLHILTVANPQAGEMSYTLGSTGLDQRYGWHRVWFDAEHGWYYCSDQTADPATGQCAYRLAELDVEDMDAMERAASQIQMTHRNRPAPDVCWPAADHG